MPSFIQRIADGNLRGAAHAILDPNPLGGMCARVCPTENLCEAVCTCHAGAAPSYHRTTGALPPMRPCSRLCHPVHTRPDTGRRVAVVGAGPAGLACCAYAGPQGPRGDGFRRQTQAGGLNEYGLARYKTPDDFAQQEIACCSIGGIVVRTGWTLETPEQLKGLRQEFDAVFLGLGLGGTRRLGVPGEDLQRRAGCGGFHRPVAPDGGCVHLPMGRRVIVIGGGMTAVDIAVQSKMLGAHVSAHVYRRGPEQMGPRGWSRRAQTHGVVLHHHLAPVEIEGQDGHARAVRFCRTNPGGWSPQPTGRELRWEADLVFKAIGQALVSEVLPRSAWRCKTGALPPTPKAPNLPGVWAGGDCRAGGAGSDGRGRGPRHAVGPRHPRRPVGHPAGTLRESPHGQPAHHFRRGQQPQPFWLASAPPTDKAWQRSSRL